MNPDRLISMSVPTRVAEMLNRRKLVVLAYHGVEDPQRFAEQLRWLRARRAPVALAEVEESVRSGTGLGRPSFLVTFDDGRRSVLERGLPVLESLGIPAALFVVAGLVGTEVPFWWDEVEQLSASGGRTNISTSTGTTLVRELKRVADVDRRAALDELRASATASSTSYPHLTPEELRELERRGIAIGSHSLTHPCLDRCTGPEVARELRESRELLGGWLAHPVASLAYPNGNMDDSVVSAAGEAGYDVGFLFDHRLSVDPPDRPLEISRVRVDSTTTIDRFRAIVSGVHPMIHRLRGLG